MHKKVLKIPLDDFERLPVVFSCDETLEVLSNLNGEFHLMASLLYGSGLRLTECLKLRIKDVDFKLNEIIVRGGKGDNDRRTILPRLSLYVADVASQGIEGPFIEFYLG